MRDEQFDVPVTVMTEKPGRAQIVNRTVQAAQFLVDKWPVGERGPKYRSAIKACMDVLEGRKLVASARRAFIVAAKEANVFVRQGKFGPR